MRAATLLALLACCPFAQAEPAAGSAPEFPAQGWLNVAEPVSLRALRGRIALLHFWDSTDASCAQGLAEAEKLEARFRDKLTVIGVHWSPFPARREPAAARLAVIAAEVSHAVLNDPEKKIWAAYGADACPSFTVIDAQGRVTGRYEGAGRSKALSEKIAALARETAGGAEAPALRLERDAAAPAPLSFPARVLIDAAGGRLFVADTGNNRVLIAGLDGKVRAVIGSGAEGEYDGSYDEAQFRGPRGLALDGYTLYVADTGNHKVRRVDLKNRRVAVAIDDPGVRLPWDVLFYKGMLYVAAAGSARLQAADPRTSRHFTFAGSGVKGFKDGLPPVAQWTQPMGLAGLGDSLYAADSQGGALRAISLSTPSVATIAGDLQYPTALAAAGNLIYIADTLAGKIKSYDPATQQVRTVAGGFVRPEGIAWLGGGLLVADAGRHELVRLSPDGRRIGTLSLSGVKALRGPPMAELPDEREETRVGPAALEAGAAARVLLSLELPKGYALNPRAPFRYRVAETFGALTFEPRTRKGMVMAPRFPVRLEFKAPPGDSQAVIDVDFYYCRQDGSGPCLTASKRYRTAFRGSADGKAREVKVVVTP